MKERVNSKLKDTCAATQWTRCQSIHNLLPFVICASTGGSDETAWCMMYKNPIPFYAEKATLTRESKCIIVTMVT